MSDPLAESSAQASQTVSAENIEDLTVIPEYSGSPYVTLKDNQPQFSPGELTTEGYESYSPLDELGRCGVVIASLGFETMPAEDEDRGSISHVYPSGWVQEKYDIVNGK
jgi:DNA-entry nuclease